MEPEFEDQPTTGDTAVRGFECDEEDVWRLTRSP